MRTLRQLRRFALWIGIAIVAYLAYSCPEPMQEDFIEAIRQSAVIAAAAPRILSVQSDGNGVVSPAGGLTVKDGVPVALGATAFSSHVFSNWAQVAGEGRASFDDASSAETTVSIIGGDATVRAVFSARPIVYYATPTGTGIYTNTKLYVHFSKDMDKASVEAPGAVQLLDGGAVPVNALVELTSPRIARITPATELQPQRVYIVKVVPSIMDLDGATMQAEYTSYLRTTSGPDIVAPSKPTFLVDGLATTPAYKTTRALSLTDIVSNDEGEVVEALVKINEADYVSYPFTNNLALELPELEGTTTILMKTVDSVGNVSVPSDATVFTLDMNPPVIGSLSLSSTGDGSGLYVNTASITASASVSDSAGSPIEMRYSVDGGATWQVDWKVLSATEPLTLGAGDGAYSVRCQFRDEADPVGHVSERTLGITLDTVPPGVGVASPAAGPVAGALYPSATASDASAGVWKVRFHYGAASLALAGEAVSPPYACPEPVGLHSYGEGTAVTFRAEAFDRAGNSATADVIGTVDNFTEALTQITTTAPTSASVSSLAFDDKNDFLYAASETNSWSIELRKSSDYGLTWTQFTNLGTTSGGRPRLLVNGRGNIFLVYSNGNQIFVKRSSNLGESWITSNPATNLVSNTKVAVALYQDDYIHISYRSSDGYLSHLVSSNAGTSWMQAQTLYATNPQPLAMSSGDQIIYLLYYDGSEGGRVCLAGRDFNSGSLYFDHRSVGSKSSLTEGAALASYRVQGEPLLVAAFADQTTGYSLRCYRSSYDGTYWTTTHSLAGYQSSYPFATAGPDAGTGLASFFIASNETQSAGSVTLLESSDGSTWHPYNVASAVKTSKPEVLYDGTYAFVSFFNSTGFVVLRVLMNY